MATTTEVPYRPRRWSARAITVVLAAACVAGCARELTVRQTELINNGWLPASERATREGQPLELNVVFVYPADLARPENIRLAPDKSLTSDIWYRDRPIPGDTAATGSRGGRFWLPPEQILLMTGDTSVFGTTVGPALRGVRADGPDPYRTKLDFKRNLHSAQSVIYVFPKFVDREGRVLPVPPAKWNPPGEYKEKLSLEVGYDPKQSSHEGQFIRNTTAR